MSQVTRCYRGIKRRLKRILTPKIDIYKEYKSAVKTGKADNLKVTAVIPNYNYERFLNERIDSILFQTYPVNELIILDDCSTDKSVELIESRIRNNKTDIPIRLIKNGHNSGSVFAQWQKAFQAATGIMCGLRKQMIAAVLIFLRILCLHLKIIQW